MNNDEWVYQYPIGKFVERQGLKDKGGKYTLVQSIIVHTNCYKM